MIDMAEENTDIDFNNEFLNFLIKTFCVCEKSR